MLYQLMKRDPAWKIAVVLSLVAAFALPVANLARPRLWCLLP
jgi:hypothetical protein